MTWRLLTGLALGLVLSASAVAQAGPRARDLGVPFDGVPGPLDAITDVPGVEVGQLTLVRGEAGPLHVGVGPVRTGVTVIAPRGRANGAPVYGGVFDLNGNGEMTGQSYLQDYGVVIGPIGLSNTNAIGQVYAGLQRWTYARYGGEAATPVVAETYDGRINDISGFHVHPEDAMAAADAARPGPVGEGNVGGGTGMVCFGFKGGIGTASRRLRSGSADYTVGVLVQCNTGDRKVLRIAGAPVGRVLADRWLPCFVPGLSATPRAPACRENGEGGEPSRDAGSIIIVVATDAPLLPVQLSRMAKRAALGLARLGSYSGNSSGDLVLSFSTAPALVDHPDQTAPSALTPIASQALDPLFQGTVEATEEAIVNALVAARTMTGIDGRRVYALPHDALREIVGRGARAAAPLEGTER